MPTLQELAALQANNPDNPFLQPHVNTPEEDAAFYNNPPVVGNIVPGSPGPTVQTPQQDQAFYNNPPAVGNNLNVTPPMTQVKEKARSSGASGNWTPRLALPAGAGGGTPTLSPEEQRLKEDTASRGKLSETLNQEQQINEKNKYLMQVGEDAAQKIQQGSEMQRQAEEANVRMLERNMQQHAEERTRQLEQEAADVRASKVDPTHWYKEKGTAGSILAAISMAAGAFAAAMPHTGTSQNFAMDIINKAVDRDIKGQEGDIENKYKMLNFHGAENDRQFVKDQFFLSQKRSSMITEYDHAQALVSQARNNTNNQVAINSLGKLDTEIQQKKIELTMEDSKQKMDVSNILRARAAAAANADPYSARNLEKDWHEYVTKTTQAGKPTMDKKTWLETRVSGGSSDMQSQEDKDFAKGAADIKAQGEEAAKTGVIDLMLSRGLGTWAPGSQQNMDKARQYNDSMLPLATRLLGDRIAPEAIEKQIGAFQLSPWMSAEQANARVEAFQRFINTGRNVQLGAKKGAAQDTPGSVPGATPVGE